MAVETGQTLSHYELLDRIGEGGMGVVWRALDQRLEREVALKLLSDDLVGDSRGLARLEREAKMIAALNHPNIVTIHSVEEDGGVHFITMEFVHGRPLTEKIPAGGLPFVELLDLALPLVDAIAAAHSERITHGDLKPANVMISNEGRVKILDFGLARSPAPRSALAGPDSPTITLTLEGHISGTVPYMAPEQIQGKSLDPASDVFSLGILLYEMATGRRPFRGETAADTMASVLRDDPLPPSRLNAEFPRRLDRIILKCLAKTPDRRFEAATELLTELRDVRRDGPGAKERGRLSIAVLPFVDMSADQDQDYFCEGVADEIINALSRVERLRVVSRTSSFRFKHSGLDSRDIGDRLGVGHLLEGSVRKAGDRLRISTQLINVDDGCQLWAERYDRQLEDVFAIQEEIAQKLVGALAVRLNPRERRAIKQVATGDVKAYDYYLRGRQHFRHFRRKSIENAARLFERAIEIDPNYAGAYAGLADCYAYLYMFWDVTERNLERAEQASRKAIDLDPELAEGHVARGVAVSLGEHHEDAGDEFETAIRLNPSLFEAYYFCARGHYARGNLEQAVRWFERAREARPEDYQSPALLGSALAGLNRKRESDAAYRDAFELAEKHLEVYPGEARALYLGAISLCQLGQREHQSLEWAERALAMDPDEPQVLYNVGCVYALRGRIDEALDCLGRTIEHGGWWKTWMSNDPDLASLRDDSRFRELIREDGPG